MGYLIPSRLEGLGERRKLLSWGSGGALAANDFLAHFWCQGTLLVKQRSNN